MAAEITLSFVPASEAAGGAIWERQIDGFIGTNRQFQLPLVILEVLFLCLLNLCLGFSLGGLVLAESLLGPGEESTHLIFGLR